MIVISHNPKHAHGQIDTGAMNRSLRLFAISIGAFSTSSRSFSSAPRYVTARTRDSEGTVITLTPEGGQYSSVLLFLHGLGDDATGWASMMATLSSSEVSSSEGDIKFILPNAPNRQITLNGGMSMPGWSDVLGLSASDKEDLAGFESSRKRIMAIVDEEVILGTPLNRICLGGFSQGGALALFTALSLPPNEAFGGVVALSTWLPCREQFSEAPPRRLPLLQVHGKEDKVVSFAWGQMSKELLSKLVTPPPRFLAIDGMGHHADEQELKTVKQFLKQIFG